MDRNSKFITVYSLSLLKELEKNKCLGLFHSIKLGNNFVDGKRRPIYLFKTKPDLIEVKRNFEDTYGRDHTSLDDKSDWADYEESNLELMETHSTDKLTTTHYFCVSRLFEAGYASSLIGVGVTKYGKKMFVFVNKPEIKEIIDQCAAEIKQRWEESNKGIE